MRTVERVLLFALVPAVVAGYIILFGTIQGVQQVNDAQQEAALSACHRGNVTRPQLVQGYLDISKGFDAIDGHPVVVQAAHRLSLDAAVTADAQLPVSAHPHAVKPTLRAIVACARSLR